MSSHPLATLEDTKHSLYDKLPLPTATSIRLLKILPPEANGLVRTKLSIADLNDYNEDDCSFTALSYAWGYPNDRVEIDCNGEKVTVTKNLHYFLSRSKIDPSMLQHRYWIDALCIDQRQEPDSLRERSAQVQMMGHIYSITSRIIVELGESDKATDVLFDVSFEKVTEFLDKHGASDEVSVKALASSIKNGHVDDTEVMFLRIDELTHSSFVDLLLRPWFARLWTVQETVLGGRVNVLCGRKIVTFRTLTFIGLIMGLSTNIGQHYVFAAFFLLLTLRSNRLCGIDILFGACYRFMRHRKASDERDYIYGVLRMTTDFTVADLHVDYEETIDDLMLRTSHALVRKRRLPIVLACGQTCASVGVSWCLTRPDTRLESAWLDTASDFFSAAGSSSTDAYVAQSGKDLAVSGGIVAVLRVVSEVLQKEGALAEMNEECLVTVPEASRGIIAYVLQSMMPYLKALCWYGGCVADDDPPYTKPLWRALTAGIVWPIAFGSCQCLKDEVEYLCEAFHGLVFELAASEARIKGAGDLNMSPWVQSRQFLRSLDSFMFERRLARTSNGLICNVPPITQASDVVAIVCGVDVPIVLRPHGDHYLLVGTCYVDGLMDGEALQMPDWKPREIVLE